MTLFEYLANWLRITYWEGLALSWVCWASILQWAGLEEAWLCFRRSQDYVELLNGLADSIEARLKEEEEDD